MKVRRPLAMLMLALAFGASNGCVSFKPVEDATRFYVLTTQAHRELLPDAARLTNAVFISTVELPAYLNDPRITVRRDEHRLIYSDLHHWSEPLRESVSRGLRDDVAALLGSGRVHPLSRRPPVGDVIEVQVRLSSFELTSEDSARLVADWRLVRARSGETLAARHADERRAYQANPEDFTPAVTALSGALANLSREIASTLLHLASTSPEQAPTPRCGMSFPAPGTEPMQHREGVMLLRCLDTTFESPAKWRDQRSRGNRASGSGVPLAFKHSQAQ